MSINAEEAKAVLRKMGMTEDQLETLLTASKDGRPVTIVEFLGELEDFAMSISQDPHGTRNFDEMVNLIVIGVTAKSEGKVRTFRVEPDRSVIWLTRTRNEWMDAVFPVMLDMATHR